MESVDIEKHFISGKYIIREILCSICKHQVGWRYVSNTYTCLKERLNSNLFVSMLQGGGNARGEPIQS